MIARLPNNRKASILYILVPLITVILSVRAIFADLTPRALTPINPLCVADKNVTSAQEKWRATVFKKIHEIKPSTRKDIPKWLTSEGGLSTADQQTYLYEECPYIKVKIRFKAVRDAEGRLNFSPDDPIESISKPYVERQITVD